MRKVKKWTEEEELYLSENAKNMSAQEIGDVLNRSKISVRHKIKSLGITDTKYSRMTVRYHYDKDFFKVIDSEEKSYWLGFIAADGCIIDKTGAKALKITLKGEDKGHLEKFKNAIKANVPVREKIAKSNGKEYPSCEIIIHSTELCNDIISYGIGHNKTYAMSLTGINPAMMKHFVRGFVDGDGSLYMSFGRDKRGYERYRYAVEIVGYKDVVLNELKVYFDSLGIKSSIYAKRKNNDKLMITRREDIVRFLNAHYFNSKIHLDRKFKKAMFMKELFDANLPAPSR
ncbi:hypothetical protein EVJ32_04515 [Exiguobacterium sp. SH5S4]|uniref:LAGLIDADG family homing endonuclease n=1 Tax=Exiguobacterium sp. SH5S4 TaxID=2510961 RepID=UPI00103CD1E1|nr:LAGLIDADG family homing endonuclease [Exiguobacterium sp. SH5S4]TCI26640.1 hypothetical protein EVJ32_04515 [Exiguobacterium sp. SH5S4]